jgi:hypothetical protein
VKIYLATAGEYSDFRVCHAFTRREDAESYKLGDEVKELELHDGPVEVRYWYRLTWNPRLPDRKAAFPAMANPHIYDDYRDFDGSEKHVEHTWAPETGVLYVQGWDRQLVLKVYSEQRAQYLARKEGVS